MTAVIDNIIAARIIYLLVLPFEKWEAFKEGIIDANGEKIDGVDTHSDNWSMLHRPVSRLKKLLGKIPGGKSVIASIAAAYLLVRECIESNVEPMLLEEWFIEVSALNETMSVETYVFVSRTLDSLYEDGIGMVVGTGGAIAGAVPGEDPPVRDPAKYKKKVMKRHANIIIP